MNKQTEDYIVLKPIAERFNKVASEITDADIKSIIKQAMVERIKGAFDFDRIGEIVETYIDEHQEDINNMVLKSISSKMGV